MYSENPTLPAGSGARGEPPSLFSVRPKEGGRITDFGSGVELVETEVDPRSIFGAAFESARVVDNSNSSLVALERAYDDRIDGITKAGISHNLVNPTRVHVPITGASADIEADPGPDLYAEF